MIKPYYETEYTTLYHGDCLDVLPRLEKVDLILTDPPYELDFVTSSNNNFAKNIKKREIEFNKVDLIKGFDKKILNELGKLQDKNKVNIYIWCNKAQIPYYLQRYVLEKGYSFDIIKWVKDNAIPLFNNKYLSDTEY